MCPHDGHDSRWRSSPATAPNSSDVPQFEQKLRCWAIQRGTPPPESRSVDRPSGPRSKSSLPSPCGRAQARSTAIDAATKAPQADQADRHPGEPEPALAGIDRHPRPGRAPDAQDGVRRRDDEERGRDQDAQLDERVTQLRAELQRRDGDRAADEHDHREVDVVLLERRRGDLGDGSRWQALQAGRQVRARRRPPFGHGLAIQHRHPGFPAFVVHGHAASVARCRSA